jgi:hypothetical protein
MQGISGRQMLAVDRASGKWGDAPGVSGAYRMLNDEELWRAVSPLVDGLKAFAERLDSPADRPVSDHNGKPASGP